MDRETKRMIEDLEAAIPPGPGATLTAEQLDQAEQDAQDMHAAFMRVYGESDLEALRRVAMASIENGSRDKFIKGLQRVYGNGQTD